MDSDMWCFCLVFYLFFLVQLTFLHIMDEQVFSSLLFGSHICSHSTTEQYAHKWGNTDPVNK